ncbi:MAG: hypothetical protein ACREGR_05115 [Minisyncoccia bacterium]
MYDPVGKFFCACLVVVSLAMLLGMPFSPTVIPWPPYAFMGSFLLIGTYGYRCTRWSPIR